MTVRSAGHWKLPQPTDMKDENEWIEIPRISRIIPFGYKQSTSDQDILEPISQELDKLELARKYVNQYSYREVANWLTQQTGRYISYRGLKKRIDIEKNRRKVASVKRELARRLEKTLKEVSKLEESTGTYTTESRTA